ncbi:MAG: retroviral-like aspartic protease family protein [Lachnospiraceae bacterium]|nr:retroviral-like aspartic protease family protein [Lachnospiraceae bacterium]
MISFSIPTYKDDSRPIIELYSSRALIDSGAYLTIIDADEEVIRNFFGGVLLDDNFRAKGIGGEQRTKLYRLKSFTFGQLSYFDIPVNVGAINDNAVDIIIGMSMLGGGIHTEVDTENKCVNFSVPESVRLAHKLWRMNKNIGDWQMLDYKDGKWINI